MASLYPGALDTFAVKSDGEDQIIYAAHVNDLQNSVVAVETELGTDPAGSAADLKTRLAIRMANDGKIKQPQQLVTVGKTHADHTTVQAAINAITDAASNKRYTILIYPGDYAENLTPKDYVDLIGIDPLTCRIGTTGANVLPLTSSITLRVENLTLHGSDDEDSVIYMSDGTLTLQNCIIEPGGAAYGFHIDAGTFTALNSLFTLAYPPGAMIDGGTILFHSCRITSDDRPIDIYHGSPDFRHCTLIAANNKYVILLNNLDANPKFFDCKLLKHGTAAVTVEAANANTDAQIYHCALNAALSANIDNLIGTPYNVIDADLT